MFYVHVYRVTMRRENKPNAIFIVSTFHHVPASEETINRLNILWILRGQENDLIVIVSCGSANVMISTL